MNHRHRPPAIRAAVVPAVDTLEGRRLMSAGALDPTFGTAGVIGHTALAVDAAGRSYVPGTAGNFKSGGYPTVTRYDADGSLDTTFGTGGTASLTDVGGTFPAPGQILVEPSGKILVNAGGVGERQGGALVQLTAAGKIDTTFGSDGVVAAGDLVARGPDGKITGVDSTNQTVERFTAAGQPDPTFGTAGVVSIAAAFPPVDNFSQVEQTDLGLTLDPAGRPVVGVEVYQPATGTNAVGAFRLTTAGKLDTTFGTKGLAVGPSEFALTDNPPSPAVAADGTVYLGYTAYPDDGTEYRPVLLAFTADGKTRSGGTVPDAAGQASLDNLAVDASGRPVVTLTAAPSAAGTGASTVDRLLPIGTGGGPTYDPTFAASGSVALPVADVGPESMFLDAAGRVVVAGGGSTARVLTAGASAVEAGAFYGTAAIGSAGSYQGKGNTGGNAFDQNLSTFYDAYHFSGDWTGRDLGSAVALAQVAYAPRAGYAGRMVGGQFQVSSTKDFSSDVHTIYTVTTAPAAGQLTTVGVGQVGADRYFRYLGPTGGECNVAEVVPMIATYAQLNGTAIGSAGSYQNQGNAFANAFDDNPATFYDAYRFSGDFVGEDFGSAVSVFQVRLAPRTGYEARLLGGQIQASDTADFKNPIDVYTIDAVPPAGTLTGLQLYPEVGAHRYWRYLGPTGGECNIAELEFDTL